MVASHLLYKNVVYVTNIEIFGNLFHNNTSLYQAMIPRSSMDYREKYDVEEKDYLSY